jgi:hypothetical protein
VAEVRAELAPGTPVKVWFQDEMRVGQKNKLTYRWAKKGSRPRASHDQLPVSKGPATSASPRKVRNPPEANVTGTGQKSSFLLDN